MQIIQGRKEQQDICLNIGRELPQYFTPEGLESMEQDLKEHVFYIAVDAEAVLGFITLHEKKTAVAEISWMAVKPANHRRGVGRALIEHSVAVLKAKGYRLLEVKTLDEMEPYPPYAITRAFYGKMGFLHLETIHPYAPWGEENPCAIYVKII